MHTIVVGVDGSEASVEALQFAIEEARSQGAEVKAIKVWNVPPLAYGAGWSVPVEAGDYARIAENELDATLADARVAAPGVTLTPIVREGQPADILCDEASGADLLVVGSRGLGGFRGLLLGSVGQQCANHSRCPVVIIPHDRAKASAPR
jgi:nucleotide-binding universal stress UspA family protein